MAKKPKPHITVSRNPFEMWIAWPSSGGSRLVIVCECDNGPGDMSTFDEDTPEERRERAKKRWVRVKEEWCRHRLPRARGLDFLEAHYSEWRSGGVEMREMVRRFMAWA